MKFAVKLWAGESVDVELLGNEDGTISAVLDGHDLCPEMTQWAIEYGFRQGIRDRAAACKDDATRNAMAWKRVDAIVNDTLGEGGGGGPKLAPVDRIMRSITEREVTKAFTQESNAAWVQDQRQKSGLTLAALRDATIKHHVDVKTYMAQAIEELAATTSRLDLSGLVIPPAAPKKAS